MSVFVSTHFLRPMAGHGSLRRMEGNLVMILSSQGFFVCLKRRRLTYTKVMHSLVLTCLVCSTTNDLFLCHLAFIPFTIEQLTRNLDCDTETD